ncbi:hypothetical protein PTKU46_83950 [Paraburkholderia terrae]
MPETNALLLPALPRATGALVSLEDRCVERVVKGARVREVDLIRTQKLNRSLIKRAVFEKDALRYISHCIFAMS